MKSDKDIMNKMHDFLFDEIIPNVKDPLAVIAITNGLIIDRYITVIDTYFNGDSASLALKKLFDLIVPFYESQIEIIKERIINEIKEHKSHES